METPAVFKVNENKIDLTLVEPWVEEALAEVYQEGIDHKYERDSWKNATIEEARELLKAAKRHINEYRKGHFFDTTGNPKNSHLMKAAWNLITLHYHELQHMGK